jgi:hypothetical protein
VWQAFLFSKFLTRKSSGGHQAKRGKEKKTVPSGSSGLGFFLFSSFCLVASAAFSCTKLF